jgi:hypothetical protein
MSIHVVDVHRLTHTCPADPQPHPYHTWHTVVHVVAGGPCRTPVTIRSGAVITEIACGRHEPPERQCSACRIIVVERSITDQHLGYHGPARLRPAQDAG